MSALNTPDDPRPLVEEWIVQYTAELEGLEQQLEVLVDEVYKARLFQRACELAGIATDESDYGPKHRVLIANRTRRAQCARMLAALEKYREVLEQPNARQEAGDLREAIRQAGVIGL